MAFWKIVGLSTLLAIGYGLIHDQITAHVCLEYFTVGHPRMFASDSPTLHALYWGIAATWWAGLLIGLILATASRAGSYPKLTASQQVLPLLILLIVMGLLAGASGLLAYHGVQKSIDHYEMVYDWPAEIPPQRRARFWADMATHDMSYFAGFVGGIVLSGISVLRRRKRCVRNPAS